MVNSNAQGAEQMFKEIEQKLQGNTEVAETEVPIVEPIVETPEVITEVPAEVPVVEQVQEAVVKSRTPLGERLDNILAEGGGIDKAIQLLNLSKTDISTLDDETAIYTHWKLENPDATDAQIRAKIASIYGDKDRSDEQAFDLLKAGKASKSFLSEQRVNLETFTNEQKVADQLRNQETLKEQIRQWSPIVDGTLTDSIDFKGTDWEFKFNLPQGHREMMRDTLLQSAIQNPKIDLTVARKGLAYFMYGDKILESAVKDMQARTLEMAKKQSLAVETKESPQTTPIDLRSSLIKAINGGKR